MTSVGSATLLLRRVRQDLPRFGLVGVISNVVYFAVLSITTLLWDVELWIAGTVSYGLSMLANYLLQRNVTFRSTRGHSEAALRYLLVQGVAVFLNSIVLHTLITHAGFVFWIGQGVALVATTTWNYLTQKYWVFAEPVASAANVNSRFPAN